MRRTCGAMEGLPIHTILLPGRWVVFVQEAITEDVFTSIVLLPLFSRAPFAEAPTKKNGNQNDNEKSFANHVWLQWRASPKGAPLWFIIPSDEAHCFADVFYLDSSSHLRHIFFLLLGAGPQRSKFHYSQTNWPGLLAHTSRLARLPPININYESSSLSRAKTAERPISAWIVWFLSIN